MALVNRQTCTSPSTPTTIPDDDASKAGSCH